MEDIARLATQNQPGKSNTVYRLYRSRSLLDKLWDDKKK